MRNPDAVFQIWTKLMQGTKYPTLALVLGPAVLPTIYALIRGVVRTAGIWMAHPTMTEVEYYELPVAQIIPGVLEARTAMCDDWIARWITCLDLNYKRTLVIATQMHPYFKSYAFIDAYSFVPTEDRAWALSALVRHLYRSGTSGNRCRRRWGSWRRNSRPAHILLSPANILYDIDMVYSRSVVPHDCIAV